MNTALNYDWIFFEDFGSPRAIWKIIGAMESIYNLDASSFRLRRIVNVIDYY